jgi:hypothetical protein
MSFKSLTPLIHSAILYAQSGVLFIEHNNNTRGGSEGGYSGTGIQNYIEFIFGDECRHYTAEDNTSGTKFYPEIKYVSSFKSYSIKTGSTDLPSCRIEAKSLDNDDFNKDKVYEPDASIIANFGIIHGDEIFGKFTRIAVERTSMAAIKARFRFILGPSTK